jgi:hypothetical protein
VEFNTVEALYSMENTQGRKHKTDVLNDTNNGDMEKLGMKQQSGKELGIVTAFGKGVTSGVADLKPRWGKSSIK